MKMKNYDVRISLHQTTREAAAFIVISFGNDVEKKFKLPFVSISEKQGDPNILYLIPESSRTSKNHAIKLCNARLQFSAFEEVCVLLDFLGEFPLRRDGEVFFIDRNEKSGYSETHSYPNNVRRKNQISSNTRVKEIAQEKVPAPTENVETSLCSVLQRELRDLEIELHRLNAQEAEIHQKRAVVEEKMDAYKKVLKYAQEKEEQR